MVFKLLALLYAVYIFFDCSYSESHFDSVDDGLFERIKNIYLRKMIVIRFASNVGWLKVSILLLLILLSVFGR